FQYFMAVDLLVLGNSYEETFQVEKQIQFFDRTHAVDDDGPKDNSRQKQDNHKNVDCFIVFYMIDCQIFFHVHGNPPFKNYACFNSMRILWQKDHFLSSFYFSAAATFPYTPPPPA